jgi:hypothetical protein
MGFLLQDAAVLFVLVHLLWRVGIGFGPPRGK